MFQLLEQGWYLILFSSFLLHSFEPLIRHTNGPSESSDIYGTFNHHWHCRHPNRASAWNRSIYYLGRYTPLFTMPSHSNLPLVLLPAQSSDHGSYHQLHLQALRYLDIKGRVTGMSIPRICWRGAWSPCISHTNGVTPPMTFAVIIVSSSTLTIFEYDETLYIQFIVPKVWGEIPRRNIIHIVCS